MADFSVLSAKKSDSIRESDDEELQPRRFDSKEKRQQSIMPFSCRS